MVNYKVTYFYAAPLKQLWSEQVIVILSHRWRTWGLEILSDLLWVLSLWVAGLALQSHERFFDSPSGVASSSLFTPQLPWSAPLLAPLWRHFSPPKGASLRECADVWWIQCDCFRTFRFFPKPYPDFPPTLSCWNNPNARILPKIWKLSSSHHN